MLNTTPKFTTSGLKGPAAGSIQRGFGELPKTQKITVATYPQVIKFRKTHLDGNPDFSALSPEEQEVISNAVQKFFFEWMKSIRVTKPTTTSAVKERKYAEIAKALLSAEQRTACLLLLGDAQKPVFNSRWDVELPLHRSMHMVDYRVPEVTGVIPDSYQLSPPLSPPPYPIFPHLYDEESFFTGSAGSAGSAGCESDDESAMQESVDERKHLEMLHIPGVVGTLCQISEIQRSISEIFNQPSLDALLKPEDWLGEKYPGSPLELVRNSDQ